VRSGLAGSFGLALSLQERLMALPLYGGGANTQTSTFSNSSVPHSSRCYTRLTENYRSHRVLLEVPSRLFYSGSLIERADRQLVDSLTDWEGLPSRFDSGSSSVANRRVNSTEPFPLLMYGKSLHCVGAFVSWQCLINGDYPP
jgi:hypothetical protein